MTLAPPDWIGCNLKQGWRDRTALSNEYEDLFMWWTEDGDRVMTDEEWDVFNTGLDLLRDFVESDVRSAEDDIAFTGIQAFDRLTAEQKLVLLADVADALRYPTTPSPDLTAENEAAIAAVFTMFRAMLDAELDTAMEGEKQSTDLRRSVLKAIGDSEIDDDDDDEDDTLPSEDSIDAADWHSLIGMLRNRFFWDGDYDLGDGFLDLPPQEARAKLELYGIDEDYFLSIRPEPDRAGIADARKRLARAQGLRQTTE